jgi:hypothetical protein
MDVFQQSARKLGELIGIWRGIPARSTDLTHYRRGKLDALVCDGYVFYERV